MLWIIVLLHYAIVPGMAIYFFCRFCRNMDVKKAMPAALLIFSVAGICGGVAQWLVFLLTNYVSFQYIKYFDVFRELICLTAEVYVLTAIEKRIDFQKSSLHKILAPMFFIVVAELFIKKKIYGEIVVADSYRGIVYPIVNHGEVFLLQAFAGLLLLVSLFLCKNIDESMAIEQSAALLEEQYRLYIHRAEASYICTREFRHDIKNHLNVLEQLMKSERDKAESYLKELESIADSLSPSIKTGNAAVDALIGSKQLEAEKFKINFCVDLIVPQENRVKDIDWCAILGNAIDNAINACKAMENGCIEVSGRKKCNMYMITVKNTTNLKKLPPKGTGLKSICRTAEKYNGMAKAEIAGEMFVLNVLLDISLQ